jgi:hypothetical protein
VGFIAIHGRGGTRNWKKLFSGSRENSSTATGAALSSTPFLRGHGRGGEGDASAIRFAIGGPAYGTTVALRVGGPILAWLFMPPAVP